MQVLQLKLLVLELVEEVQLIPSQPAYLGLSKLFQNLNSDLLHLRAATE